MSSAPSSASSSRGDIRYEADIQQLLAKMPNNIADSFSNEQLIHLKTAIGSRHWAKHKVDLRGTLSLPLYRWRFYYVILFGRNRRSLSAREKQVSALTTAVCLMMFISFCALLGLLVLYLFKSAAGIDILPNYSFGIWDYFKDLF